METIAWDTLQPHLEATAPSVLPLGGTRSTLIGYIPTERKLWLRLPCDGKAVAPTMPFAEIIVEVREVGEITCLEISSTAPHLYRELHRFGCLIAEDFEVPGRAAIEAFGITLTRWKEFSSLRQLMSSDQVLGLIAELLFLLATLEQTGAADTAVWTGRDASMAGRHDFRLATVDVEVKATRSTSRTHVVHGLAQLEPTPGRRLYLLSIRLEDAGAGNGWTLPSLVDAVRSKLLGSAPAVARFDACLAATGYRADDANSYQERVRLADACRLIEINDAVPALTRARLAICFGQDELTRISDVTYRLNVDGLGTPDGHMEFTRVLGIVALGVWE
jgi:Putative  PD-(D/E)XK family member, (DUF4420)